MFVVIAIRNRHLSLRFRLFNELRYFNELKAQYVVFRQSRDQGKAQHCGNGKQNALQSLEKHPVLG